MTLAIVADGEVCFWYAGESEGGYDGLRFFIDSVEQFNISGDVPWTQACHPVLSGSRTFRWEYEKDGTVSTGAEASSVAALSVATSACAESAS